MRCLVCGKKNDKDFGNYFSFENLKQCKNCGFVFVADFSKIKKQDYQRREDYPHSLSPAKKKERLRNCQSRLKLIKENIGPGMSILEIGSHDGTFLKLAQGLGCQVIGLEPNYQLVDYAKSLNLPVIQGQIEDFKTDKRFDIVALFHVLEHLHRPGETIQKINSLLKPQGHLILELPNMASFSAKKLKEDWNMIIPEHLFYFSPETVKMFLANNGFLIKKIHIREFNEWNLSIKESLVRLGLRRLKRENQFQAGSQKPKTRQSPNLKQIYLKPIRFLLNILVKIFQMGDYMFIIAQKSL